MKRSPVLFIIAVLLLNELNLGAQSSLTIEKIMQGEYFTGFSPEGIQWSQDNKRIYFSWNPAMEQQRSLYYFEIGKNEPVKATADEKKNLLPNNLKYNRNRSKAVYSKDGDLFLLETRSGKITTIISSVAPESSPIFNQTEDKILFTMMNNLYSWDIETGMFTQLTDFRPGIDKPESKRSERDEWLYHDQMQLFKVLEEKRQKREIAEKEADELKPVRPKVIYTGTEQTGSVQLSPDGKFITWISYKQAEDKRTIIPSFVTESGYTEDQQARSKVGMPPVSSSEFNICNIGLDTVYRLKTDGIEGISEKPGYLADYQGKKIKKDEKRLLSFSSPVWSDDGKHAVISVLSDDHKDRWIMLLDINSGTLRQLDRQHDDAWIGGPGIGRSQTGWLPDNKTIFFQSEESGFSHLYKLDITTGEKKVLTSGNFEVYEPRLSNDRKFWYFISNEADHGIRELYRMPVIGGTRTRLTNFEGGVEFELSPDEKFFALRVSHSNNPWELFLMVNKENASPVQITRSAGPDFSAYNCRVPEFIKFRSADGTMVPARLYKPANMQKGSPAVVFVHGAGYLQNAHRWWSNYFREYMFHNFLADNGYAVLDIDYRGSAGYGRNWRTGIYRHMGGKDLDDHIDGARFIVEEHGIDPDRIGIYGGSYGGFITLMAMFTKPGVFKAGAALRSVTDWAHYNHGYTSNILNTPASDSLAYVKSSPIYYAEGLKDALLICHGMVDDNVHFQDVVRLVQRLIELGKENWELAVYPVESHGFTEPSSWTDEYKRVYRLFEENLKAQGEGPRAQGTDYKSAPAF